jgi:hypothetical protein
MHLDFQVAQTPVHHSWILVVIFRACWFSYIGKRTGHHRVGINSVMKFLVKLSFRTETSFSVGWSTLLI